MNTKLLLPFALISAFALAACEDRADPPAIPDPDAGAPESEIQAPEESDVPDTTMTPEEMAERREEIEQEAQQTFESIMERTDQAGENLMQLGDDAMNALSQSVTSAADAIEGQIDALVENAATLRDENLTEAEKLEIVSNVRTAAEEAARALGQSEAEIVEAGDVAEDRARQAMGLEE